MDSPKPLNTVNVMIGIITGIIAILAFFGIHQYTDLTPTRIPPTAVDPSPSDAPVPSAQQTLPPLSSSNNSAANNDEEQSESERIESQTGGDDEQEAGATLDHAPAKDYPSVSTIPRDERPAVGEERAPPSRFQRFEISRALDNANHAVIQSGRALNPRLLYPYYSSGALQVRQEVVQSLYEQGKYIIAQCSNRTILSLNTSPDGRSVEVRSSELWRTAYYSMQTGNFLSQQSDVITFSRVLARIQNGWTVISETWE